MSPLAYIMKEMKGFGAFMAQWQPLSDSDKNRLKEMAIEEMTFLGIEVK